MRCYNSPPLKLDFVLEIRLGWNINCTETIHMILPTSSYNKHIQIELERPHITQLMSTDNMVTWNTQLQQRPNSQQKSLNRNSQDWDLLATPHECTSQNLKANIYVEINRLCHGLGPQPIFDYRYWAYPTMHVFVLGFSI